MSGADEILPARSPEEILGYSRPIRAEVVLKGKISRELVEEISRLKGEPDWMRRLRLRALEMFEKLLMPRWLVSIEELDLDEISYYVKPEASLASSWDELPKDIRQYYELLGIPEIEAKLLAGINVQFESETIYSKVREWFSSKGVVMVPMEEAVKRYPDIVKEYFGRIFPIADHKFAALHYALWSGGAFVYVPKGVRIPQPLEAFFLIGNELVGQFEHTLIIADEGAELTFIEGCSAPMYRRYSFHDGAVELYAAKGAKIRFVTIQNWSRNVINFNNKRGIAEERASIDWVEGSIGSKVSYVYPSTVLRGKGASSRSTVVTIAKGPYIKDSGSKMIHAAPETKSTVINKSVSADGGVNVYRGLIKVLPGARDSIAHVSCESLILDDRSAAHTYPHNQIDEPTAQVTHEATTGRLSEEVLTYLMNRGLNEREATSLAVLGFMDDVLRELPFEYANVLRKVVELEFSKIGGVG